MQRLFQKTDKHIIPALERYSFPGRIEVVQSITEAEKAVNNLMTRPILGIDTETRPVFRRGGMRPVALLQVSDENICFLFRLSMIGLPPCVIRLLQDTTVIKVGLSLKDDLAALRRLEKAINPGAWVDIQAIVREMGIEDQSLQKIVANVFGKRLSKSAQLSNWEADIYTDSQKMYAATDAYACLTLYHRLQELQQTGDYYIEPSATAENPNPKQ